MNRYTLHTHHCVQIGGAETAQAIANMATPGTYSQDHSAGNAFPYVIYSRDSMGMLGTPCCTHGEAFHRVTVAHLESQA